MSMVNNWAQLTEREQNTVMMVLAGIFATIEINELDAAEWYDSGYLTLIRERNGCRIMAPESPNSELTFELAKVEY